MKITLNFWQSGSFAKALCGVLETVYGAIETALDKVTLTADPERCPAELLDLIAWQRGVDRLPGEDEALYRLRIKYAYANARDAGSPAGFARIWSRLNLGTIAQTERPDLADNWDVILVQVDYAVFSRYAGLFDELVRLYGRTCRRYVLAQEEAPAVLQAAATVIDATYSTCKAVY
ncbi:MAG: phage tail protein [Victivallaceae bacterium]|nr:phage tail protein [Victivallaceae bacterium]